MESGQIFSSENYFGKYELIVREEVGKQLDDFKRLISQIENKCTIRIMNIDFKRPDKGTALTTEKLIGCDKDYRCKTLSALLYNDALWRLEAAHLMMCAGLLNVAYANLRASLEFLQTAFIVERSDEEALRFLENKKVNLSLMEKFLIDTRYSDVLRKLKDSYSVLGVHRYFSSLQLSSLFGASRFSKYAAESTEMPTSLQLPEGFSDVAKACIAQGGQVGLLFSWLESIPVKS